VHGCVRGWSSCCARPSLPAPPAADCGSQAAALVRDEADLPRIDLVSPVNRPPYCITLETIMAFAGRVKAHVAQCPTSDFAQRVSAWDQTRTHYAKLFGKHRCRRTL
jgi:hypothetical protein